MLKAFSKLKVVKELQSFLGLASYYKKFIHNYSHTVNPLMDLTCDDWIKKKPKDRIAWSDDTDSAFLMLKKSLSEDIVLEYRNFSNPFVLVTDASNFTTGGVLQLTDSMGNSRPFSNFSHRLNSAEMKYLAIECEALAYFMVWRLRDHWFWVIQLKS